MHRTQQAGDRTLVHRALNLTLVALAAVITALVGGIFAARVGDLALYPSAAAGAATGVVSFTLGVQALEYLARE